VTDEKAKDEISGTETTGHEWDGIKELDTPLPKWWVYVFYTCIIWGIAYQFLFPAWPYFWDGAWHHTTGFLGYTQRNEVTQELADVAAGRAEVMQSIAKTPINDIAANSNLIEVALAGGKAAFGDNCAPCHGSGAQGSKGYPNLNDDDWLWGGTLTDIQTTITHGIRAPGDDETRYNMMPRFLDDQMLKRDQIGDVADYVLSLSGTKSDPAAIERGAKVFAENCVSCHGADAKGNQELGAPNLTDAIWLYGGDRATVVTTIEHGRGGVMPNWGARLSPGTIKELALYVHSLGGGK